MNEPIIHVIRERATQSQLEDMASYYGDRIKVAVDVTKRVLAGGGAWHINCKEVLVDQGSDPKDIWGGGYSPSRHEVDFLSHINIRPQDGNFDRYIESQDIRTAVKDIIHNRIGL